MQLEGITALVVDDHRDTLELAGMVLEWDGAHVLEAKSAEEALKLLDRNVVDVVVCDAPTLQFLCKEGDAVSGPLTVLARFP